MLGEPPNLLFCSTHVFSLSQFAKFAKKPPEMLRTKCSGEDTSPGKTVFRHNYQWVYVEGADGQDS